MSLRAVSASQLETFSACRRKWAWRALEKIEVPPHASAAKGSLIHKQFEAYLKGESLDYSSPAMREAAERALPGVINLPPPQSPGMLVEHGFSFETSGGIVFRGFMDVVLPDSGVVPGCEGGAPCVIDHKSTSSFRYLKSPEVLRTDVQAMIYAYRAMAMFRNPTVDLVWNYVRTKDSAQTQRVHLRVVSEHVTEQFLGPITKTATELVAMYAAAPRVLDLPPSLGQCDAYGGCPYKLNCTDLHSGPMGHLTHDEELNTKPMFPSTKDTTMTQSGASLFDRLETAKAQEDKTSHVGAIALEVPVALPAGISDAPAGWTPPAFLLPKTEVVAINPPEWQPPPTPEQRAAAAVATPAEEPPAATKRKRRTKAEMQADAEAAAAAQSGDPYITKETPNHRFRPTGPIASCSARGETPMS